MSRFTTRISIGIGLVALVAGLGLATMASAQDQRGPGNRPFMQRGGPGGPDGPGGPGGPLGGLMLGGLDLTEAQREQVRAIMEAQQPSTQPLLDRAQTARQALQAAIETRPVDEAMIRSRSAELAAVEADLAVSRAHLQAQVWAILTPEQQAQHDERRAQREQQREQRGARRP